MNTLEKLKNDAIEAKAISGWLILEIKKGAKRPKGFPRGRLLEERENSRLYAFDPEKILNWLKKVGLEVEE